MLCARQQENGLYDEDSAGVEIGLTGSRKDQMAAAHRLATNSTRPLTATTTTTVCSVFLVNPRKGVAIAT